MMNACGDQGFEPAQFERARVSPGREIVPRVQRLAARGWLTGEAGRCGHGLGRRFLNDLIADFLIAPGQPATGFSPCAEKSPEGSVV